ncbi:hypothetical protein AGMMS50212_06190 [Spirochaetia bacterium]|nr:hypothetical protein AGMMS50212_06190 [Spirochaetia bacterium]
MGGQEIKDTLARNIKSLRLSRQLSQADLAEKANISITFLSNIERGNKWPYVETLSNIAMALNVNFYELFNPKTTHEAARELLIRFSEDITKNVTETLQTIYSRYEI